MRSHFPSCYLAIAPIIVSAMAWMSACGGSPTKPASTPTPPPTPNDPPVIVSLTSSSPRVDADDEITLTAVVQDDVTPVDQLTYQWSTTAIGGDFVGSGAQVRWHAPHAEATPGLDSFKLTVVEKYVSAGQPAQHEVSKAIDVHYNDSPAEVRRISLRFLTELFPDFSVSPPAAVQDFSDSCVKGKADELSDITNNRKNFHILSGTYTNVSINFNAAKTAADVKGQCTFVDIPQDPSNPLFGRRESVTGICTLTAVYESWRWYLCTSSFSGIGTTPLHELRYRVPGTIISRPQ